MGIRDFFKQKSAKINTDPTPKINSDNLNPRRSSEYIDGTPAHKDIIQPPQPYTISQQSFEVRNAVHRYIQTHENPFLWKVSFGLANKLLCKQPYPFSYAKPYDVMKNGNTPESPDSPNLLNGTNGSDRVSQAKSNAVASTDAIFRGATPLAAGAKSPTPFGLGANSLVNTQIPQKTRYEIRTDLAYLYQDWLTDHMFELVKRALGIAFTQCVAIVKTQEKFWIFDRRQIKKVITKKRIPYQLEIEWPAWSTDTEELKDNNTKVRIQNSLETYTIGKDCVFFVPIETVDSPFGIPFILPMWRSGVFKDFGSYLHMNYMYKAGILLNIARYPNTISQTTKDQIEKVQRQGITNQGIQIEFPAGMSPENVDKMFQFENINANDLNWDEYNALLAQDSMFPASYINGEVETGALGGSAPEMDQQKEDEQTLLLYPYVDQLVKLINSTFYHVTDVDYIVIPWQDAQKPTDTDPNPNKTMTPPPEEENPDPKAEETPNKEETVKVEIKKKSNYLGKKVNSIAGVVEYDAVLLPIGEWPYGDHTEIVDYETVNEYWNDPLSVKEGYFHKEHPDDPSEVARDDAIGKYKITGITDEGLIGKIYSKEDLGDEITLSNFYFSHDDAKGGKIIHRRIDFRNVVQTANPRMSKARGKKTDIQGEERRDNV